MLSHWVVLGVSALVLIAVGRVSGVLAPDCVVVGASVIVVFVVGTSTIVLSWCLVVCA